MNKSIRPIPNWLGWIKWRKLHTPLTVSCCDCGLAHDFQFRNNRGILEWRAKKNKIVTKYNRTK